MTGNKGILNASLANYKNPLTWQVQPPWDSPYHDSRARETSLELFQSGLRPELLKARHMEKGQLRRCRSVAVQCGAPHGFAWYIWPLCNSRSWYVIISPIPSVERLHTYRESPGLYHGETHYFYRPLSIAMLVYQRVNQTLGLDLLTNSAVPTREWPSVHFLDSDTGELEAKDGLVHK